jgi:hypothetical protein
VDTRGEGGQIIVAPARNQAGPYRWLPNHAPWERPLASAPKALLDLLTRRGIAEAGTVRAHERCCAPAWMMGEPRRPDATRLLNYYLARAYPGCRNTQGFYLALQLRDNGYTFADAHRYLWAYQHQVNDPANPYSWPEALASLHQAYRRAPRAPWSAHS